MHLMLPLRPLLRANSCRRRMLPDSQFTSAAPPSCSGSPTSLTAINNSPHPLEGFLTPRRTVAATRLRQPSAAQVADGQQDDEEPGPVSPEVVRVPTGGLDQVRGDE